jgi:glycosyltransferase involved in cell wall biosynthesis
VFNEGDRLQRTVDILRHVSEIDKYVVVDDGSTDGSVGKFMHANPDIHVIHLERNLGKSEAVRRGLKCVKSTYILLYDADVRKMNSDEISKAVRHIQKNSDIDMLIFRRLQSPWIIKLLREDIILSGERLAKTTVLKKVMFGSLHPENFGMEAAMNQFCIDNHLIARWYPSSTTNTYKIMKFGLIKGWYEDVMSVVRIGSYIGWKNYINQLRYFCREKI